MSGEHQPMVAAARGTVVFQPAGADSPPGTCWRSRAVPSGDQAPSASPAQSRDSLRARGQQQGERVLAPNDPCQCRADTVFEGELSGDVIEGKYTVSRSGGDPITGSWKVKRKKT
jgi:hypothetical protein